MVKWLGLVALTGALWITPAQAEDGYDLWLRYRPSPAAAAQAGAATGVVRDERDPTIDLAAAELARGLSGLIGRSIGESALGDGSVVIGTPRSPRIAALRLPLGDLGREGYVLRSMTVDGRRVTVVAANAPVGVLYGSFRLLRTLQTGASIAALNVRDRPKLDLRLLNHWDNPDRYVERGYAGRSLWDWQKLPGFSDPRYTEYARANASVGINGTVLNNVNASAARRLSELARAHAGPRPPRLAV